MAEKRDRKKPAPLMIALIALAALLAAGGITAAIFAARATRRPASLTFAHEWNESAQVAALRDALSRFSTLYPHISVTEFEDQPDSTAESDLRLTRNPLELAGSWLDPPSPWTGDLWLLAARREILDAAAKETPEEITALREGKATPEQFRDILSAIAKSGRTPITLGNSHRWPFILWLEHWTAATQGARAVQEFPLRAVGTAAGTADDPYTIVGKAFDELMEWKGKRWFVDSMWNEGWARGLGPLDRGEAAFGLVSASYMTPLQTENLDKLEFLSFPCRAGDPPWSVGSVAYLAVSAETKHPKEARLLVHFLTSPGISADMTRQTRRPFFSWNADTGAKAEVLPSWAAAAMTPEYEELARRFDPGK